MKKDKNVVENQEEKISFFKKMKEDKKYSAKVQLIGYGIFLLVVIVFLNIGSATSVSGNYIDEGYIFENQGEKLIEKINDNYRYDVSISVVKLDGEVSNYHYYGKKYGVNKEINKEVDDQVSVYYKVNDYYYAMNGSELIFVDSNVIYDLVKSDYIELDGILELINKASLDHISNNSDGSSESIYNLYVRDEVISVKNEDIVSFNVKEEDDKLVIDTDYTNLIKVFDNTIASVKISYTYSDIDMVEEFSVIEENNDIVE